MVITGIEKFFKNPPARLIGKRLGLLCNQASVDCCFRHSRDLVNAVLPGALTCLFSPQHGFYAEKQDNMVESHHGWDKELNIPIFSLYDESRKPSSEMFDRLDVLLVDLVDVGTRVYTFMTTLVYCLEAAARLGKTVMVMDRPNPLGGLRVEGNLLDRECRSFVGLYPLPMRHGLTMAELGRLFNEHFGIGAEYEVVSMDGWQREMYFSDTGLPWVYPSPNMPRADTALVYPGQVIWEGTNISEGRGTTLPFEISGAPFLRPEDMVKVSGENLFTGANLRPLTFQPFFHKWAGEVCHGCQIHVTNPPDFSPYRLSLVLLQIISRLYPGSFALKEPPYEYEYEKLPLDLILGSKKVRLALLAGEEIEDIENSWQEELAEYDELRRNYFLY
ncbi:MAG: exo-beta-N-acetylmuramidase NamZ family protein [Thermodesulfobacteriota bacterium]